MVAICQSAPRRPVISLTPLIDVVFILLVFFMLASSFLDWRSLEIGLLVPGVADPSANPPLQIRIAGDGTVSLDGRPMAGAALDTHLAGLAVEDAARPVMILSEDGIPLQRTIAVIDRVSAAGLSEVSLAPVRARVR